MRPRHAIRLATRGLLLGLLLLPAVPAGAQSDHDVDEGAPAGVDAAAPEHDPAAQPAPPPDTPRTTPTTHPQPHANPAPATTDTPKVLGRQFPAPVQPPPPAEAPEVHITVVPGSEPRVGKSRLRQGDGGDGSLQGSGQGGDNDDVGGDGEPD